MPAPVLALQLSRESNSDQKSEGRGFLSHPGQSFLCPCVGPFPLLGLMLWWYNLYCNLSLKNYLDHSSILT